MTKKTPGTVLFLVHSYPPIGGSGMIRSFKFTKYLAQLEWKIVVLTAQSSTDGKWDDSLLRAIPPSVTVFRTQVYNPLELLMSRMKDLLRAFRALLKSELHQPIGSSNTNRSTQVTSNVRSFLRDLTLFPDEYLGWLPTALRAARKIIGTHKIDLIFSSSPPATAHLAALALKKFYNIPWVMDMRDPWSDVKRPTYFRLCHTWFERKCVYSANTVVLNTNLMKNQFLRKYPVEMEKKFHIIPNGYDPDDFPLETNAQGVKLKYKKTIFSHIGEFYDQQRTPICFLRALEKVISSGRVTIESVEVRFIGGGEYLESQEFRDFLSGSMLRERIIVLPRLPHKESIRQMFDAHVLLLFQNAMEFRYQVPAKLYEYLRTPALIMAFTGEGATRDLLTRIDSSFVFHPDQEEAIVDAIHLIIAGKCMPTRRYLDPEFSRKQQTVTLSEIFLALVS